MYLEDHCFMLQLLERNAVEVIVDCDIELRRLAIVLGEGLIRTEHFSGNLLVSSYNMSKT